MSCNHYIMYLNTNYIIHFEQALVNISIKMDMPSAELVIPGPQTSRISLDEQEVVTVTILLLEAKSKIRRLSKFRMANKIPT
jgi:hypothetical protein